MIVLSVLLFATAFVIRDGYPSLGIGMTFAARALGTVVCVLAAGWPEFGWLPLGAGLCLGLGFWTDMKHANGQQARNLTDALWLAVSGITSLVPLGLYAMSFYKPGTHEYWPAFLFTVLVGLVKIPIWFGCWKWVPEGPVVQPTRVAALILGLTLGILLLISLGRL